MKIYFEDGPLRISEFIQIMFPDHGFHAIDAGEGVSICINTADTLRQNKPNGIVYTNCLELFHNRYAWNEDLKVPEIYIRHKDSGEFVRIDEATDRELREGHNLEKLYLSGEFDDVTNALDSPPLITQM